MINIDDLKSDKKSLTDIVFCILDICMWNIFTLKSIVLIIGPAKKIPTLFLKKKVEVLEYSDETIKLSTDMLSGMLWN